MYREGEVGCVTDVGGGNFTLEPEGDTAIVDREGDPKESVYLTFGPGGLSKINWNPTEGPVSESSTYLRGKPSSDSRNNPTGSSTIPIPEDTCKILTCKPILVESHPTRGTNRPTQHGISDVNIYESLSMPSVKVFDPIEASSASLCLPPE